MEHFSPEQAGMENVGGFCEGRFVVNEPWRTRLAVYAWLDSAPNPPRVLRVGIACAKTGMQARYASYNRWLDGRFKPHDAREQAVSRLFRSRLHDDVQIWAVEVPDKSAGLALERRLRKDWQHTLDLDLMVKTSWVKGEMNAWRAAQRAL